MSKNTCKNCQYWREPGLLPAAPQDKNWCSNSKTEYSLQATDPEFSCDGFWRRGKKASKVRVIKEVLKNE